MAAPKHAVKLKGRCSRCNEEGLRSTVSGGHSIWSTCMGSYPYWDEEGRHHSHDPNWNGTSYGCSNGHSWKEQWLTRCGVLGCDYGEGSLEVDYRDAEGESNGDSISIG